MKVFFHQMYNTYFAIFGTDMFILKSVASLRSWDDFGCFCGAYHNLPYKKLTSQNKLSSISDLKLKFKKGVKTSSA